MKPPVFLDRDGVINRNRHDYVRSIDDWVPLPGSIEAIVRLSSSGHPIIVVTNQSAVARGYCTTEHVTRIHRHLLRSVEDAGGCLAGVYYCPHHPDEGCSCRKPGTGMVEKARNELDLAPGGYMVGDAVTDIQMGNRAGLLTIMVRTGRGIDQLSKVTKGTDQEPWSVTDDLARAAGLILEHSGD